MDTERRIDLYMVNVLFKLQILIFNNFVNKILV